MWNNRYNQEVPSDLPEKGRRRWRLANALSRLTMIIIKDNMGQKPSDNMQLRMIHNKIHDKHALQNVIDGIYYTLGFLNTLIEEYPANNEDAVEMAKACIETFGHNGCAKVFEGLTDSQAIKRINMVQMNQNKLTFI